MGRRLQTMFELFRKKSEQYQFHALEKQASELRHTIAVLEEKKNNLESKIQSVEYSITVQEETLNKLTNSNNAIKQMEEYGIPYYNCGLDELTTKRYELQDKVMSATNDGLWKINRAYTLNDSYSKGQAMQKAYGDGLVYAFTEYFSKKEKSVTEANIQHTKEMIKNEFNAYQKKAANVGIALNSDYVKARLNMLDVNLAIKVKEKEEKARIREEKKRQQSIRSKEWHKTHENPMKGDHRYAKENNPMYGRKGGNHPSAMPVQQLTLDGEFIQEFASTTEAAQAMGLYNGSHITECCKGKRNKCCEYKWKYKNEDTDNAADEE